MSSGPNCGRRRTPSATTGSRARLRTKAAIDDKYLGVIFVSFSSGTPAGVLQYLGDDQNNGHYYDVVAKVPRVLRGEVVGDWRIWAPLALPLTSVTDWRT